MTMLPPVLFALLLFIFFVAYVLRTMRKEEEQTASLMEQIRTRPDCLEGVRLADNDPITVEIKMVGGDWRSLSGIHGVPAVRLFDSIRVCAPKAEAYTWRNGHQIAPREFDRIREMQWPYPV